MILSAVWTTFFGPTKSKDNLYFKFLQEKWDWLAKINRSILKFNEECEFIQHLKLNAIDSIECVLTYRNSKNLLERDDYKEVANLALFMKGQ